MEKAIGLFWRSVGRKTLIRSLSTSAPVSNATTAVASKKPKHRKKKNLFEVAQFLPNWGIGYQLAKTHWVGVSYEITKINLYKDGQHGKAWGVVYKNGMPAADAPKKISGVHKRCWRYVPDSMKATENLPNPEVQRAVTLDDEIFVHKLTLNSSIGLQQSNVAIWFGLVLLETFLYKAAQPNPFICGSSSVMTVSRIAVLLTSHYCRHIRQDGWVTRPSH